MSDLDSRLDPDQRFKRILWRSVADTGSAFEQLATWFVAGIAATLALLLAHIDSVRQVISPLGLRWGLGLLCVALLFGILSRQIGMGIATGLSVMRKLEAMFGSEQGKKMLSEIRRSPHELIEEVKEPFRWPLSKIFQSAANDGFNDFHSADKRLVRMFCVQVMTFWIHSVLAAAGIMVMALSIR